MEASEIVADLLSRGWTQVQIADRTGIPQPTLSKIVRKEVQDVMSRSYRKLAALHAEVSGASALLAEPAAVAAAEVRDAA